MSFLRRCCREAIGLFIDDGAQAVFVLAWVAVCSLLLPRWAGGPWGGLTLFAGLAAIFMLGLVGKPRRS